jgi:imidazolonepropionase-like amidohydrolase
MVIKKSLLAVGLSAAVAFVPSLNLPVSAIAQEEKPKPQVLFTNVNVFDGKSDKLAEGMSVLVEGNLIKKIDKGLKADANATVIDGGGRTMVPGMIDTHTHLSLSLPIGEMQDLPWDEIGVRMVPVAEDFLLRGFTTVRDFCGNSHGLRRAINAGVIPGPRIVSAGACITPRSGHGDWSGYVTPKGEGHFEKLGMSRIVSGPDEMRAAIREEMRRGASFIKIMMGGGLASSYDPIDVTTFSLEEVKAAVDETENWGTYVSAHVFTDHGVKLGLEAGMKTFDHTNLASEETYEILGKRNIPIGAQVYFLSQIKGPAAAAFTTPEQRRKAAYMAENGHTIFEYGKKYGVRFGFGVDLYGDVQATRQTSEAIVGRREYFSDSEILKQIYENNVVLLELSGDRLPYKEGPLGVIKEGAYADLLLVEGNPLEDIGVLADWKNKIDLVMKDGKIYKNAL